MKKQQTQYEIYWTFHPYTNLHINNSKTYKEIISFVKCVVVQYVLSLDSVLWAGLQVTEKSGRIFTGLKNYQNYYKNRGWGGFYVPFETLQLGQGWGLGR